VESVLLWDETMTSIGTLPISGLQLPELLQLTVSSGAALDLSATTPAASTTPTFVIPAPQTSC
jgi:hypothetical protein